MAYGKSPIDPNPEGKSPEQLIFLDPCPRCSGQRQLYRNLYQKYEQWVSL